MTVTRDGVDGEKDVLISDNDYTAKDELKTVSLGKHPGSSNFLQQIDYLYNQVGYLTHINGGVISDSSPLTDFCSPTFPVLAPGSSVNARDLFAPKATLRPAECTLSVRATAKEWQHSANGLASSRS